ncbi:MAG: hypothetical protein J3K34DRAFT_522931 [Monoraphidium minutum]|nr:MAG: hypothetical protein J3K34DRAFT_522931 [Monoraphidium minutum]
MAGPRRRTVAAAAAAAAATAARHPPRRVASPAPAAAAAAPAPAAAVAAALPRFRPESILPLVSSAVESSAEMARFESVAGRSAMVGFLVAAALEGFSSQPAFAFGAPGAAPLAALAAASVLAVAAAGAAAAAAARPRAAADQLGPPPAAPAAPTASGESGRAWWWLGAGIHESVMSSLTATRGSASGVTQLRVDEVVDFVVDRCLGAAVHPVFGPSDSGSAAASAMDTLLAGDSGAGTPQ